MGIFNRVPRQPSDADWYEPDEDRSAILGQPATSPVGSSPEPAPQPPVQTAEPSSTPEDLAAEAERLFARLPVAEPTEVPEPDLADELRITASEAMKPRRVMGPEPTSDPGADGATGHHAKVISFANQKGGVAKTTSTLNLAVAFAESGHRVLCIDLDPQGNLTMSQGIDPDKVEHSLYDVLVNDMPISEIIVEREIDIAVASIDLAGAEIAMSTKIGRERTLEKALKEVSADYDFVCIDTPPSLGLLTINALTAANKVIVPVQCEYLSMRGLVQLQNTLRMIQENLNPDVRIE